MDERRGVWCGVLLWVVFLTGCAGPTSRIDRSAESEQAEPRSSATVPTDWESFGHSVQGRPLRQRSIGRGPRRALWIGGIHGDEVEGMVATEELPSAFAAVPGLGDRVTLTIVEDVNPDGRAARRRGNSRGVDLNRNYPAENYRAGGSRGPMALSEPEARALYELLGELQPDVVLVAHSWGRKPTGPAAFVNFDGPAEALAERFSELSGMPVVPSTNIHGTPGSLGSLVGIDRGIPILTIEWEKGTDPIDCWQATSRAILAVIAGEG